LGSVDRSADRSIALPCGIGPIETPKRTGFEPANSPSHDAIAPAACSVFKFGSARNTMGTVVEVCRSPSKIGSGNWLRSFCHCSRSPLTSNVDPGLIRQRMCARASSSRCITPLPSNSNTRLLVRNRRSGGTGRMVSTYPAAGLVAGFG